MTSAMPALGVNSTEITHQVKFSQNVLNGSHFSVQRISAPRLRRPPKYVLQRFPRRKDLVSVAEGINR